VLPNSTSFISLAKETFSFLGNAGFEIFTESSPTSDSVIFKGKNVAVQLSTDRRDDCIDFTICKVADNQLGNWRNFHGFLVSQRSYRGSFAEFQEPSLPASASTIVATYAAALQSLTPEIIADSPSIFGEANA